MKKSIFINTDLQKAFDEKGVVKCNFIDRNIIEQLQKIFDELHPVKPEVMQSGYYFSVFGTGQKYMQEIYNRCTPLLLPYLEKNFTDFKVVAVIMQMKGKGENSIINPHQDLTVVDEEKYSSVNIWIPLTDSVETNGPLFFLEKSQFAFRNMRCHTSNYQFGNVQDYITKNATRYLAETGEALIFDPATIHFSPPNISDKPRASIAISIVSKEAPLEIFYYDKKNTPEVAIEKYSVPDNFWYLYQDFSKEREQRPGFGKKAGTANHFFVEPYSKEEFINKYETLVQ